MQRYVSHCIGLADIVNGDDAVTVENGANNVTVRNILMAGPGSHGMSVGSLGQNQAVYNKVNNSMSAYRQHSH
jgi:hypothetical protein